MRGRKDRLGRSLGEVKSLGLGEAPSEAEVFLCHTLAVRCGPQHPWHSVGTSMKRRHQCPPPRVVVGITPSASTHSLTQEEVMKRCRGNEPCSVTYTVREGVLMKVALCEWPVWRLFSKGGTLFLFAWCQPCSWAYSLSTSVECRWCICRACRWNVNKYIYTVQFTGLLFFSN